WEMTASTIGLKVCATGEIISTPVHLSWPVAGDDRSGKMSFDRLAQEQVCALKVRKMKAKSAPNLLAPHYCIVSVLDEHANCPELMPLLEEFRKEVVLEDEDLGTLVLNKDTALFEGKVDYGADRFTLYLEVDALDKNTWTQALNAAKALICKGAYWDQPMCEFAAKELSDLANDYREEEDYDDESLYAPSDLEEISEEEFACRIYIFELIVNAGGEFTAYYNDDDMFSGRVITVTGSLEKGIEDANLKG
ncbi:MAG: DUF2262 domain-containing protein, partial [Anaerobiospirillum succiniciproducens]|uniref:DUF2262 domain-containing protein n=1 Tax=Anaerobiospirillum succiniciproducens TaxID=13335 RepID=UPI0026DBEB29